MGEQEKYDEAIECFNKAIEINPEFAGAWYNKGIALGKLKKYDEALKCFNKAIEINPEFAGAWYNKGELLYELGDYASSERATEESLRVSPSFGAYFLMGKIYVMNGEFEKSIKYFDNAKKLKPSDIDSTLWRIYAKCMHISYPSKSMKEKEREETVEYQGGISSQILWVEELINSLEERRKSEEEKAIPILYYWLAIFYAKVGGYLSSVENFGKSIDSSKKLIEKIKKKNGKKDEVKPLKEVKEKAINLSRYIWNSKINSTFWNWWLFSPKHLRRKIKWIIFGVLSAILSFLVIVLPLINSISFFGIKISNPSWDYWVVSIIALFFIILSPWLNRFKASDMIDIELPPPPEITVALVSLMPMMKETMGRKLL